jgi:4-aminobutyrate aminotransferase / (S)-3-amino-2-methylpropionate transaminase / 5-aminovalerate transaminase
MIQEAAMVSATTTEDGAPGGLQGAPLAAASERERIRALDARYLNPGAGPADPLVWDHASGSLITDVDGREYIDLASGTLITNLGHAHPGVTAAVAAAAARSLAFYNSSHRDRAELAARLAALTPGDLERSAFFSSGSEAVDAAVRLARLHTGRTEIVSFTGAFHGRSYLPLSVSGLGRLRQGVGLGVPGVIHAPYPDRDTVSGDGLQPVRDALASESGGSVAAILAEPYQGAGGVIIPPHGFLPGLRRLADELGALLIIDEVQSSYGRTGPMLAIETDGVTPDIVLLGKAMGNGYPVSAMIARSEVCARVRPEQFSSSHSGNPGGCAAALAVLDAFEHEGVLEAGARLAAVFASRLDSLAASHPRVVRVRQQGLAIGVEVRADPGGDPGDAGDAGDAARAGDVGADAAFARRVVAALREAGIVMNSPIGRSGSVLRVAPALTMPPELAGRALDGLEAVLTAG